MNATKLLGELLEGDYEDIPDAAKRRAVHEYTAHRRGPYSQHDVIECGKLAGQKAREEARRRMMQGRSVSVETAVSRAVRPPSPRARKLRQHDLLAMLDPAVRSLRRRIFGNIRAPYRTRREAAAWIESQPSVDETPADYFQRQVRAQDELESMNSAHCGERFAIHIEYLQLSYWKATDSANRKIRGAGHLFDLWEFVQAVRSITPVNPPDVVDLVLTGATEGIAKEVGTVALKVQMTYLRVGDEQCRVLRRRVHINLDERDVTDAQFEQVKRRARAVIGVDLSDKVAWLVHAVQRIGPPSRKWGRDYWESLLATEQIRPKPFRKWRAAATAYWRHMEQKSSRRPVPSETALAAG